jgi:hypothetical protein
MFRDFTKDPLKSTAEIYRAKGKMCCVEGCNKSVTKYQGPGQEDHCRQHQKNLMEYGGTGKIGKAHSHARERSCSCCGYTPEQDPAVISAANGDAKVLNRLVRSLLEVDHLDGDHENNDPSNLETKCIKCHRIKTIVNEDYLSKKDIVNE